VLSTYGTTVLQHNEHHASLHSKTVLPVTAKGIMVDKEMSGLSYEAKKTC
jgi:hypothetical protein